MSDAHNDLMPEAHFRSLRDLEYSYWWHQSRLAIARRLLAARISGHPRLLDLGCGTGGTLEQLAKALSASRAVGVDASPSAEAFSKERHIEYLARDLGQPFTVEAGAFDAVTMMDVLEHLPDERPALETACINLREGGVFLCTVPAHPWLFSSWDKVAGHYRRYTRTSLPKIFQGLPLRLVKCSYAFSYAFPPAVLRRWIGRDYTEGNMVFPPVSRPVNALLLGLGRAEAAWLCAMNIPFGLSVVGVAIKESALPGASARG